MRPSKVSRRFLRLCEQFRKVARELLPATGELEATCLQSQAVTRCRPEAERSHVYLPVHPESLALGSSVAFV